MAYWFTESAGNDPFIISYHKRKEIPTYAIIMVGISGGFPFVFKNFLMRVASFLSD